MTGTERARLMRRFADLLAENAQELATVESTDNGKLLREMGGQLGALAEWYYYFAGAADKIQGETIPSDKPNFFVYTTKGAVGVVGAIVPWNSPLLLLTFKLAPSARRGLHGCGKTRRADAGLHSGIREALRRAGFPPGVVNVVTGFGEEAGRPLVRHPGVDKVAFTGSTETGISVMKDAADHLARSAWSSAASRRTSSSTTRTSKPRTTAWSPASSRPRVRRASPARRLFVHERAHDELVERLSEKAGTIKLGNPLEMETEMGPVAFKEQLDKVQGYIEAGRQEGAELVYGGKRPEEEELKDGYFIEPTIFTGVDNDMRVAREEIFGPVLSVIPFESEEDLIRQANDTRYGLAAGIWTRDIQKAHRVAHALRAGTVWVNSYRTLSFNTPFGGYKMSGMGRENGLESLKDYTQVKSVWVELSGQTRDPFKLG